MRLHYTKAMALDDDTAWDGVEWIDLATDSDFLEKARAILNEEEYDTRIVIPLSLSDGFFI